MTTYKKTVKKYNNKKKNAKNNNKTSKTQDKTSDLLKNSKNNYSTGNKINQQIDNKNSDKSESHRPIKKEDYKPKSTHQNSNLKEKQDQDILSYNKEKYKNVLYCIIICLVTIIAIILIPNNPFNKTFPSTNPEIILTNYFSSIMLFFVFYIFVTLSVCLITLSSKTDNYAYTVDVILFSIMLAMCFTLTLLLYQFELMIPAAIISCILSIISIYLCYRYYVSFLWSGIIQTLATLCLLYSSYVTLAFSL